MLARTNWTGKKEFHDSQRKAVWFYNEVAINYVYSWGYSHLSDTEAPIILANSKAPEIMTVFWLGSYLSDSKKGPR